MNEELKKEEPGMLHKFFDGIASLRVESGRFDRYELPMMIAILMQGRNTCDRAKGGCAIVKDGRIISTGYVSASPGHPHCDNVGHLMGPDGGCIRTIHAEAAAITFAAKYGVALQGATLYTVYAPCLNCAKLILSAGISQVFYLFDYRDQSGLDLLYGSKQIKVCTKIHESS